MSAASGGNSEPKQGQRSQSARGFCPRSTMRVPQPDIIEHFGNADAVPQLPERCLSRKAGIVRCCPKTRGRSCAPFYSIHIYQQAELPPAYRAKRHIRGQFLLIRLFSGGVLRCHSLQIKSAPHPRWSRGHRSAAELPAFRHRWSGRQHTFLPLRQTGCHHPHTGCRSAPLP